MNSACIPEWRTVETLSPQSLARALSRCPLGGQQVHLWFCHLEFLDPAQLRELLPSGERARADRFLDPRDAGRFLSAHGALRLILSAYTGLPPAAIAFRRGPRGKPFLEGGDLQFNLSHSAGIALVGLARRCAIGVDIEKIKTGYCGADVASHFFAPAEVAALDASPPDGRSAAFFRLWTRKEAYIKCTGSGLNTPLNSFDVTGPLPNADWQMAGLDAPPGFEAAVVVAGPVRNMTIWTYKDALGTNREI